MIWLIGNRGMLGTDVEAALKNAVIEYCATDAEVDICDIERLRDFAKGRNIEWIINCSAYTAVDTAEDEADRAFSVNAEGVKNIALITKELKATLIHFSTDYVFDGKSQRGYVETDEPGPINIYGRSKLHGESHIRNILSAYYILRISWLYGKNGKNFVETMLNLFNTRNVVSVVDDQWGSPTSTTDVAEAVLKILRLPKSAFGLYHFGSEEKISWYDFAVEILKDAQIQGRIRNEVKIIPIKTVDYPTRAERPVNSYLNKNKIKTVLQIYTPEWRNSLWNYIQQAC